MTNQKKEPAKQVKRGNIVVSIWANETQKGTYYNITAQRFYKDGNDWRYSDSFGRDDILLLCKVLDEAHSQIYELQSEAKAA